MLSGGSHGSVLPEPTCCMAMTRRDCDASAPWDHTELNRSPPWSRRIAGARGRAFRESTVSREPRWRVRLRSTAVASTFSPRLASPPRSLFFAGDEVCGSRGERSDYVMTSENFMPGLGHEQRRPFAFVETNITPPVDQPLAGRDAPIAGPGLIRRGQGRCARAAVAKAGTSLSSLRWASRRTWRQPRPGPM
jgi:hypothetical protein